MVENNNFEICYILAFPAIWPWPSYYFVTDTIGTTAAGSISKNILEMISWEQEAVLSTLITKNEDIKNNSRIAIIQKDGTVLDTQNTDPLSWEIANYLFEEIKKPIKSP